MGIAPSIDFNEPGIIVNADLKTVALIFAHEQMHSQNLSDVDLRGNTMHFEKINSIIGKQYPFQFKKLESVLTGSNIPTNVIESQWQLPKRN